MNALVQALRSSRLRLAARGGTRLLARVGLVFVLLLAACGPSSNLVVVNVQGLVGGITELYVTMQLDGVPARNSRPVAESGDGGFVVYKGMERFGIEVPPGTGTLSLDVKGFGTTREIVRSGSASLNLAAGHELTIQLAP